MSFTFVRRAAAFFLCSCLILCGAHAIVVTAQQFDYLYFSDHDYYVSSAPVEASRIGTQLGVVCRSVPLNRKIQQSGDSNTLPIGIAFYVITENSSLPSKYAPLVYQNGQQYYIAYPYFFRK